MSDVLSLGKQILQQESLAIRELAESLDERFLQAVYRILCCEGNVIVCGIGKAGLVGQKISATLASTGTPSHFLHPAEAIHGDLGKIGKKDIVLILSQSGETEEIVRILPLIRQFRVEIIAITASEHNTLGRNAHVVLPLGQIEEADSLGLAPSTSTAVMIALGDALALVVSQRRRFRADNFAVFHPGGALGRKLSRVDEHVRGLERCRIAPDSETIREVFVRHCVSGRRSGAILLTGEDGRLSGIFTDSDLAKLFEQRNEHLIDLPIRMSMTSKPTAVLSGTRMLEAIAIMSEKRISELPVINTEGFPLGMIDITDVIAAFPETVVSDNTSSDNIAPNNTLLDKTTDTVIKNFPPEKTILKIA
ncbi:MAG: KpsF/GutQ family sugar-phosphate isomerase [Planctomycetaceae bacterium]|jgi:arabinose-5-phosphate isomerase|nr:KpsF/GutQ family sugar-phosphate isomerase [Planctomycetaceae bacterium]